MIATSAAVSAAHQRSALPRSSGCAAGSREFGTHNTAATIAITASGTFTRKIDPHQKRASSNPPAIGPAADATPATPDQIAIARPRSCWSNTLPMIDSVAGIAHAPPMPITPRVIDNMTGEVANAAAPDATPKTASPMSRSPLRP